MRLEKKNAESIDNLMLRYIKAMRLAPQHNTRRVFMAWDEVSGAARYTLKKFYRDGKLYITLSSSVLRTHLSIQKVDLIDRLNARLAQDELFLKDDPQVGFVKDIILK
ncbi:MAG: DUF721 domain-containing protein [Bacteroidales bacterium]|nr:DUF721 domain-containing protein [Candidatus Cryptobacteroides aphodequi]